jgi:hypothetical protein
MKITMKIKKEIDIKTLIVNANVRYWEDATVNGFEDIDGNLIPCRENENWKPIIDIESGQILNWNKGTTASIHYKVCDAGLYSLQDIEGNIIITKEGYVPKIMCPEEEGYGDYIIMNVDENGFISKWIPNLSDFKKK